MKTFKLISLQVVEDDSLVDIDLIDGLIINQENDPNTWLLEAYVNKTYNEYFQKLSQQGEDIIVQVVITKKENSPAAFQTKIVTIKHVTDHISILFEGKLMKSNYDYAEIVLKKLIEQGLTGDKLLKEFKTILRGKPQITAAKGD
ncbi:YwpF-like family protein [Bacillus sp. DTU_2020_1000418_1_SI_GHA_SEK_038]|uniref:YwpF-like family protein n=1 Tax=Bacillus sp. DTU_2020_1000418_1_SI_GHA_SEK_038 TaxID=3077585 RepID=UPI0028EBA62B|nr:YwpF-like family protein [Bacillus sp. DTU_2020_1000418_1_SI_GHA_SEK_038]WNS75245.1 YwpF-like family protein [Bacillus sp. DTU_2020_1000418_1_SI_GHA_SEK_038]